MGLGGGTASFFGAGGALAGAGFLAGGAGGLSGAHCLLHAAQHAALTNLLSLKRALDVSNAMVHATHGIV